MTHRHGSFLLPLLPLLLLLLLLHSPTPVDGLVRALSKRGVCVAAADHLTDEQRCEDLQAMQSSWYYNWYSRPSCLSQERIPNVEFVPMIFGPGSIPFAPLTDESEWLLGFNEPNMDSQANMTPAEAAALWPVLEATGRRLVGPAVADCGVALGGGCTDTSVNWYREFMGNCTGCRINAVAVHAYYCDAQDQLNKLMAIYEVTQRPIWLTEFACDAPVDPAQPKRFAEELLPRLEALGIVSRYAWFISYCKDCQSAGLLHNTLLSTQGVGAGALTDIGTWYGQSPSTSPLTVSPQRPIVAIDCGAEQMGWDSRAMEWMADDLFGTSTHTAAFVSDTLVTLRDDGRNDPDSLPDSFVFQSVRLGESTYTLPVAEAGTYTLRLFFSDPQSIGRGQRVFRIEVQGTVVDGSVDVFARAGGAHQAYVLTLPAVVANAQSQPTPMAVTVALRSGSSGVPLIAGLTLNTSMTASSSIVPPDAPVLVNMGASAPMTDSLGRTWLPSTPLTLGGFPAVTSHPIAGTTPDVHFVFQTHQAGEFSVFVPSIAAGTWRITLLFAETYWRQLGQRVFELWVQGTLVDARMDLAALVGLDHAHNVSLLVEVPPAMPFIVVRTVNLVDRGLLCGVIAQREEAIGVMQWSRNINGATERAHPPILLLWVLGWVLIAVAA